LKLLRGPLLSLGLLYSGTIAYYRGGFFGQCFGAAFFLAIGLLAGDFFEFRDTDWLTAKEGLAQIFVGLLSGGTAYLLYKVGMRWLDFHTGDLIWALPTSAAVLIVATATAEEIFFRGYIQKRISLKINPVLAIVCVSLLVAIYKMTIHSSDWSWGTAITIGGVSMVGCIWTGLLFYWSNSLLASIVCHVTWDLLVYCNQPAIPYWLY
jgi:membrane protease YdiL (CAAX protease family)